jgi:hypothetical protein
MTHDAMDHADKQQARAFTFVLLHKMNLDFLPSAGASPAVGVKQVYRTNTIFRVSV